jgi:protein O-GlcNAc transferase
MNDNDNLNLEEIFSIAEKKHKEKRLNAAKSLYNQILKKDPNYVAALNNLAILSNQLGENLKALNCFKKLIEINPKDFNSYNNLGVLYERLEENQKSLNCYEKAIQINPNFEILYFNQGNILKKLKELKKATNSYKKTIQINPSFVEAYYNLGTTFRALGELQKAISFFKKTTQINTQFFRAYNELGVIYNELGQYKKAINFYEMAIKANPKYVIAYMNLGSVFKEQGEHQMAVNYYKKATEIEPENITSHWLLMNTFPKIYQNIDEIDQYEKNFLTYVKKINLLLDTNSHYTKKEFIEALTSSTNFFLPYQGRDILNSQIQYANLIERITKKIYKEFHTEKKIDFSTDKIKIGFISSFFRHHTVFKLFKNWIIKLNQNYFKKYIYYCDNKFDYATNEIKQNVNYFYNSIDVDEIAKKIEKDKLDILIYLDIGMRSKIQILSSMRLAPIQCSTWGHPITSGFKNIDYFFSSELMENKNSSKRLH